MIFILFSDEQPQKAASDISCYAVFDESSGSLMEINREVKYEQDSVFKQALLPTDGEDPWHKPAKVLNGVLLCYADRMTANNTVELTLGTTVVQCVIPQGASYYYNDTFREYVADTILIKGVLERRKHAACVQKETKQ